MIVKCMICYKRPMAGCDLVDFILECDMIIGRFYTD